MTFVLSEDCTVPLLDHFHPPLLGRRHWEGFYAWWAATLSDELNKILPAEYFAEFRVKGGGASATDAQPHLWAPPTRSLCG